LSFKSIIYYCNQCKKIVDGINDLFFVEDGSQHGFCSEKCIEVYFNPFVAHFEKIDKDFRAANAIDDSDLDEVLGNPQYIDKLLSKPDEIWRRENDLKEENYSLILNINHLDEVVHLVALCLVFNHRPSFIFFISATKNQKYLMEFKSGTQIKDVTNFLETPSSMDSALDFSPETLMNIDLKKSLLLSDLLKHRKESDIPFENFMNYMDYFESTMREPDEVFTYEDDEGDIIYTHLKVHDIDDVPFFYFSVCLYLKLENGDDAIVPILSFPTIDPELTERYRKGDLVSGVIKN